MPKMNDQRYRRILRQLLSSLVLLCWAAPSVSCELSESLHFTEAKQGVYVHEGLQADIDSQNCGDIANIGFIVGETSVAVIDPGGSPAVGRQLLKAIEAATPLPISHVIITHFHPDHFFGGFEMGDAIVVAHVNYSRALLQRGQFYLDRYTNMFAKTDVMKLVQPSVHVEQQELINLGSRALRLTAHKTAHSDNDLSVFDVESGVLWAGDLLFHERVPSLDGSVNGWLAVMDELGQFAPSLVIPGHGPIDRLENIAPKQRRYLEALRNQLREVIKENGRLAEAVETVGVNEHDNWLMFDDFHRGNVTKAFTELEWE